jgi:ketosteroid isomerase-like protein
MAKQFDSAQDAEDAFYDAFEESDIDKMMDTWADNDDIACVQPMNEQIQGRTAVRQSWEQVFSAGMEVDIEIHHQQWIETANTAIHIVHQQLTFAEGRAQKLPALVVTNIYLHDDGGWHLVVHHASPQPPPMPTT